MAYDKGVMDPGLKDDVVLFAFFPERPRVFRVASFRD